MNLILQTPLSETMARRLHALFASSRVHVLGRNRYAESVAQILRVSAFVDDYTDEVEYLGRPVIKMGQIPTDALLVSCVVEARPLTALASLKKAGFESCVDYFTLYGLASHLLAAPPHSARNFQDITSNSCKYEWLSDRLVDDESRRVLEKIINFRLNWNLEHMHGFTVRYETQYFEPFVRFGSDEVFVDGGGFDGKTSRAFAERAPGYKRIHYFEPSPDMMSSSQCALADVANISYVPKGLFSRNGIARFDASAGSASGLDDAGTLEIPIVRLDDEVQEPVSFIKLDLEGAECDALEGAREHLRQDRPKLAVSVYHDQRDFWRVPEKVLSIDDSYQIHLRHYTEGPLETVMYFT